MIGAYIYPKAPYTVSRTPVLGIVIMFRVDTSYLGTWNLRA